MSGSLENLTAEARFAPTRILIAGGVVAFAWVILCVWLYLDSPSFGFSVANDAASKALIVSQVDFRKSEQNTLMSGDIIVAFETIDGNQINVDDTIALPEGGYGLRTRTEYQNFFHVHERLYSLLQNGNVVAVLNSGERRVITPRERSILDIPILFWLSCFCGLAASIIGVGVWSFRQQDTAAINFALNGLGMFIAATGAAVINNRELTLDPFWFKLLTNLNLFGVVLAVFAFSMVLYYYPRRLAAFHLAPVMYGIAVLIFLIGVFEIFAYPGVLFVVPVVFSVSALLIPFGIMQWRQSRHNLVDRAAVSWLLTVIAFGFIFSLATNLIPLMLTGKAIVSTALLYLLLLVFYIAIAFGIIRYRLFNLDRWWFEALIWGVGGLLVLVFDVILLWLNAGASVSLGVSLALAGWLYFPIRQWMWARFIPSARQTVEHHLPELITTLFTSRSRAQLSDNWQELLQRVFQPLSCESTFIALNKPSISNDGLSLNVPGIDRSITIALSHGHKGGRLFNAADVRLADAMLALVQQAAALLLAEDERTKLNKVRAREKEILLQDLHDGVGGIATSISLLADLGANEETAPTTRDKLKTISSLSREALTEIRSFMQTLDDDETDWLSISAELRTAGRLCLEPHDIRFEMRSSIDEMAPLADSIIALNLFRIFKEALTNILKHANASAVEVEFIVAKNVMSLRISDNGSGIATQKNNQHNASPFSRARGLSNLNKRAIRLGGVVEFENRNGTHVLLTVPLPVQFSESDNLG